KIMNQYEQRQQEEETNTKNSLLPTILKKRQELGISNSEPPFLKSMTVDELQLYFKELLEQESSSIRLVS
uniref:hypothetical protein n=1 Tax=Cyanothece sp. BG0011 TaxID=2082950 RepID=UPI001E5CD868